MTTILNIQSSPNLQSSASRAVSKIFCDTYLANHAGSTVLDLDLALNPPGHFSPDHLGAFFAPPEAHSAGNQAALAASDAYLDQLNSADVVVFGVPMHNLGISSTMKSWVDNILRAGKTFRYTDSGIVGLLSGKKVVIIVSSGGVYSSGPMAAYDHCGTYLRDILATIGLTDSTILRVEGLAMGPAAVEEGMAEGRKQAVALAS